MKNISLTFLALFAASMLVAQTTVRPSVLRTKTWLPSYSAFNDVKDVGFGFSVAGSIFNTSLDAVWGIINLDGIDSLVLEEAGSAWDDEFHAVCSDVMFHVFAGYSSTDGSSKDVYMLMYNSDMDTTAEKILDLPYDQELLDVVSEFSGTFYGTGYSSTAGGDKDFFLMEGICGSTLDTVATETWGGSGDDILYGIAVNFNMEKVIVGTSNSAPSTDYDMYIGYFNGLGRALNYDTTYSIPGDQVLYSVIQDYGNARYIATGYTTEWGQKDILVVIFDQYTFDIIDYMIYPFYGPSECRNISSFQYSLTQQFALSGYIANPDTTTDMILLTYDPNYVNITSQRIVGEPGVNEFACGMVATEGSKLLFGQKDGKAAHYEVNKLNYTIDIGLNCPFLSGYIDVVMDADFMTSIEIVDSATGSVVSTNPYYENYNAGKHYINITYNPPFMKWPAMLTDSVMGITVVPLSVDYTWTDVDCENNPGSITINPISGNGGYGYEWSHGVYDQTIQADTAGTYYCTVTDVCATSGTQVIVFVGKQAPGRIEGYTYADLTLLTENHGTALLMQLNGASMDTLRTDTIGSFNIFEFDSLPNGEYIVKMQIDSTNLYPTFTNSYFCDTGAVYKWEHADTLIVGCDSLFILDLYLYELMQQTPGNGTISGHIWVWTDSKAVGEPVPGAEILVEQEPTDIPVQCVYTDQNGFYEANGLAIGYTYRLTVDVPGYGLINTHHNMPITSSDTLHDNMNFYVDTTGLEIMADTLMTGSSSFVAGNMTVVAFPVPAADYVNFEISLTTPGTINAEIIDIEGRTVASLCNELQIESQTTLTWQTGNDLKEGLYFVRIQNGSDWYFRKLIITR